MQPHPDNERNLFGPPPEEMLDELQRLAQYLEVEIRYEPTGGKVGCCLLHGRFLVVADRGLTLREKIQGLALSLADLDYENVYLTPACRDLLEANRGR